MKPAAELVRYVFYTLCLTFGTLTWSMTISHLYQSDFIPSLRNGNCTVFTRQSSALCVVLITFGVIMTVVLLIAILWHSLIFFNRPFLPYLAESVLFACLSLLWFIFALAVLIKGRDEAKNDVHMRTVIGSGFAACAAHLVNAIIAFLQDHVAEVEKERKAEEERAEQQRQQEAEKDDSEENDPDVDRDPDEDCDLVQPLPEP